MSAGVHGRSGHPGTRHTDLSYALRHLPQLFARSIMGHSLTVTILGAFDHGSGRCSRKFLSETSVWTIPHGWMLAAFFDALKYAFEVSQSI
jgi:hypothetical protein